VQIKSLHLIKHRVVKANGGAELWLHFWPGHDGGVSGHLLAPATLLPRKEPLFTHWIVDRVGPTAHLDAVVRRKSVAAIRSWTPIIRSSNRRQLLHLLSLKCVCRHSPTYAITSYAILESKKNWTSIICLNSRRIFPCGNESTVRLTWPNDHTAGR